jgi:hypothetical protein
MKRDPPEMNSGCRGENFSTRLYRSPTILMFFSFAHRALQLSAEERSAPRHNAFLTNVLAPQSKSLDATLDQLERRAKAFCGLFETEF